MNKGSAKVTTTIQSVLRHEIESVGITTSDIRLEHPASQEHGDYTSNIALRLAKELKQPPLAVAQSIADKINANLPDAVKKVEAAAPGFINFWLSDKVLADYLQRLTNRERVAVKPRVGSEKFEIYENTQPNTNKPLHIGHLRNTALGLSIVNLRKQLGKRVWSANINNDRGAHICKAMWGYLQFGKIITAMSGQEWHDVKKARPRGSWQDLLDDWIMAKNSQFGLKANAWSEPEATKPDHFVGEYYFLASQVEQEDKEVTNQIQEMLLAWENNDKSIHELWKTMNNWFYEGFRQTHARFLGISTNDQQFDKEWYESQLFESGKLIILDNVGKGLFYKREDGAILAKLESYDLPDKVALRSDGTSVYLTFDLELARRVMQEDEPDLFAHVVGNEQDLYFKQLFAICDALGFGKKENYLHVSYGMVNLKGGMKMSSREGTVVTADELMDSVKEKIATKFSVNPETAEAIAIGAIKYWMLKYNPKAAIEFDVEQSVSVEGNSGPYLQYTYARTRSVLEKSEEDPGKAIDLSGLSKEELVLVRTLYTFSDAVVEAAENYAPNLLTNYLFNLAQQYNTFYQKYPILQAPKELKLARLAITRATGIVLKEGLGLLAIQTPERM